MVAPGEVCIAHAHAFRIFSLQPLMRVFIRWPAQSVCCGKVTTGVLLTGSFKKTLALSAKLIYHCFQLWCISFPQASSERSVRTLQLSNGSVTSQGNDVDPPSRSNSNETDVFSVEVNGGKCWTQKTCYEVPCRKGPWVFSNFWQDVRCDVCED